MWYPFAKPSSMLTSYGNFNPQTHQYTLKIWAEFRKKSIVMEYCDDGDLMKKIVKHQKDKTYMPEEKIWRLAIDVLRGLKALHELKIVHRNLKSANILLTQEGTAKIADLSLSKVLEQGLSYSQTGTPYYASPEVWQQKPYDCKSDIWSLGCVIYEACSLKPPFRGKDINSLFKKIVEGVYSGIPSLYSSEMGQLIRQMLIVQIEQRPNCDQLLGMEFINKFLKEYEFRGPTINNTKGKLHATRLLAIIQCANDNESYNINLPKPNYIPRDQAEKSTKNSADTLSLLSKLQKISAARSIKTQSLPKLKRQEFSKQKLPDQSQTVSIVGSLAPTERTRQPTSNKLAAKNSFRRSRQKTQPTGTQFGSDLTSLMRQKNEKMSVIYEQSSKIHYAVRTKIPDEEHSIKKLNFPALSKPS